MRGRGSRVHAMDIVGWTLIAGLVVSLIGAVAWNPAYEHPEDDALVVIAGEHRRRAWIHLWMIPALFLTSAGLAAATTVLSGDMTVALIAMAAAVYAIGAVCFIASLGFRLTVVAWAAERRVEAGSSPEGFAAYDAWAGSLYAVHMASAYVAFALLGAGLLADGLVSTWVDWLGVGWGWSLLVGFVATRFSGPFNPPFWAHAYTAVVGLMLLRS